MGSFVCAKNSGLVFISVNRQSMHGICLTVYYWRTPRLSSSSSSTFWKLLVKLICLENSLWLLNGEWITLKGNGKQRDHRGGRPSRLCRSSPPPLWVNFSPYLSGTGEEPVYVGWKLCPAYSNWPLIFIISLVKLVLLKGKSEVKELNIPLLSRQRISNQNVSCLMAKINVKDNKSFSSKQYLPKSKARKCQLPLTNVFWVTYIIVKM